jgi:hypothetical protein
MIWSWQVGNDLTGWTLGGATVPTISADGQIDLYDATNLANQTSSAYFTLLNTLGQLYCIFHCKFTRQADDTGADDYEFLAQIAPIISAGRGLYWRGSNAVSYHVWYNNNYGGNSVALTYPAPVVGQEHDLSIILTPKSSIVIMDNIKINEILTSNIGGAVLSATPYNDWLTANKTINFFVRHQAGQVSHYRVRDIRVSRLVGVSV